MTNQEPIRPVPASEDEEARRWILSVARHPLTTQRQRYLIGRLNRNIGGRRGCGDRLGRKGRPHRSRRGDHA